MSASMPAPPASNNKRKRPLVGTPKTESPSKKKLHGQTYEVLKKNERWQEMVWGLPKVLMQL